MMFFSNEPQAVIADISPTVIDLLGLTKPNEMSGQGLKDLI
jgi:bisphosphoglycerate-independent phosphoglycerate mutase (AlkP superfamily)